MKKELFTQIVNDYAKAIINAEVEDLRNELHQRGAKNPFSYGLWCEANFEKNLREDYERKTTFTNDFSLAEWCVPMEGMKAISDTFKNVLKSWCNDVAFFAELILVLNLKSLEHHARGNQKWSSLYSDLYYQVRNLYFDWFDDSHPKHNEAMQYYYDYID